MAGIDANFSPDGSRVAATSADGRLTVWNTTGKLNHEMLRGFQISIQF
jgi:WD40 repeat protein